MNNKLSALDDLRVFLKVAELKSFKKAADHLGMPYSTSSALIQRLEKQLNTQLFIRSTRSVRLSEAGKRFYPKCLDILKLADIAVDALHDKSNDAQGKLVVSAPFLVGQKYIAPLLPEFFNAYPNIQVCLQLDNKMVNTMENHVDIVFRVSDEVMPNMIAKKLASFRGGLYVSERYQLIHDLPQSPEQLDQHTLISNQPYEKQTVWHFTQGQRHYQHQFETCYACNEVDVIAQWVYQGIGIAWLPEVSSRSGLVLDQLQPVLADWELQRPNSLWLAYHERRSENPLIGKFIDFFTTRFMANQTKRSDV
jgi:DNA-binding transcriptional LysR family regulator